MRVWRRLALKLDHRSARERWLIAGSACAILVLLADQLVLQSLLGARAELKREIRVLETGIQTQNEELVRLQATLAKNPNAAVEREVAQLEMQLTAIHNKITEATNRLVDPKQMAGVLQTVLERAQDLRLIALENIEPEPLNVSTEGEPVETDAYRHGLRIELEGSFADTLAYLQQLEALPWDFYWDRLEIIAGEYPKNRISIEVYTISIGRLWLGV